MYCIYSAWYQIFCRSIRMEFEDLDAMKRGVDILVNRKLLQMWTLSSRESWKGIRDNPSPPMDPPAFVPNKKLFFWRFPWAGWRRVDLVRLWNMHFPHINILIVRPLKMIQKNKTTIVVSYWKRNCVLDTITSMKIPHNDNRLRIAKAFLLGNHCCSSCSLARLTWLHVSAQGWSVRRQPHPYTQTIPCVSTH